jgi:oligopeptide/dipeptide ABC transporter ATP-binding protein
MDSVIQQPAHPYTQLLLESVPSQDPRKRWTDKRGKDAVETSELHYQPHACVFVERCPHAMDRCRQQRPAAMAVNNGHSAACFLHGDKIFVGAPSTQPA